MSEVKAPTTPNTQPKPLPATAATDEQLKIWQERPCGDTQCRCTELHLDQAIVRIEQEREMRRELASFVTSFVSGFSAGARSGEWYISEARALLIRAAKMEATNATGDTYDNAR